MAATGAQKMSSAEADGQSSKSAWRMEEDGQWKGDMECEGQNRWEAVFLDSGAEYTADALTEVLAKLKVDADPEAAHCIESLENLVEDIESKPLKTHELLDLMKELRDMSEGSSIVSVERIQKAFSVGLLEYHATQLGHSQSALDDLVIEHTPIVPNTMGPINTMGTLLSHGPMRLARSSSAPHLSIHASSDRLSPDAAALKGHVWAASQALKGHVWAASKGAQRCLHVQNVLDNIDNDVEKYVLAAELKGHVREAGPHSNHVFQKYIKCVKPKFVQFIIEDLRGFAVQVARDPYGTRILQRLIENCPSVQLEPLVKELLADAAKVCSTKNGCYVMESLLEFADESVVTDITWFLCRQVISAVQANRPIGAIIRVITKALETPNNGAAFLQAKLHLGTLLLHDPARVVTTACCCHGKGAIIHALHSQSIPTRTWMCGELLKEPNVSKLEASKCGRPIAEFAKAQQASPEAMQAVFTGFPMMPFVVPFPAF